VQQNACIHTYDDHFAAVNAVKFHPDGTCIASGGADNVAGPRLFAHIVPVYPHTLAAFRLFAHMHVHCLRRRRQRGRTRQILPVLATLSTPAFLSHIGISYECTLEIMFCTNPATWKLAVFWKRTYAKIAQKLNKTAQNRRKKSPRTEPRTCGIFGVRSGLGRFF